MLEIEQTKSTPIVIGSCHQILLPSPRWNRFCGEDEESNNYTISGRSNQEKIENSHMHNKTVMENFARITKLRQLRNSTTTNEINTKTQ